MSETPKTDARASRILRELGPHNNGRFSAMADFAREQERELESIARMITSLSHSPSLQPALERWADKFLTSQIAATIPE